MKWIVIAALVFSTTVVTEADAKSRKPASEDRNSITDVVKKVRDDDEGVNILFVKSSGSYYLRRDVADFDSSKKKLDDSLKTKKPVSVTVDPVQLNILEVK